MKRLILFDIDGTLIRINKAGKEAFFHALSSLFPALMTGEFCFSLRGMTDLGVFTAFCRQFGIAFTDTLWQDFRSLFSASLSQTAPDYSWELLPGADDMLKQCLKSRIGIGLATGNTREGSRHKLTFSRLSRIDLEGGFGDDSLTKTETIRKALEVFSPVDPAMVLYFGDTVSDFEAARDHQIPFIGITGLDFTENGSDLPFPVIRDYRSLLDAPSSSLYREIFGESGSEQQDPPL